MRGDVTSVLFRTWLVGFVTSFFLLYSRYRSDKVLEL